MDGETVLHGVGDSLPRLDAADKIRGSAKYSDDLYRPGMLFGALLGSPLPSARIVSYDVQAALALNGVKAVLTGADIPTNRWGGFVNDETALAVEMVRYVGEPVAAVAATDPEIAKQALELIEIEFEELNPVHTIDDALQADAPLVHADFGDYDKRPGQGDLAPNEVSRQSIVEGDVAAMFAECDVVVENTYEVQAQSHVYLEPCSALAEVDESGKVTVWSANQSIYKVQASLSKALGLPMSKIRAITPPVGGAFGGKSGVTVQPITVLLAMATGRPVKLTLSRTDDMMMMRSRHAAKIQARTGAMTDGTLVAHELNVIYDGGAYAEDSAAVLGFGLLMARGPYKIPHSLLTGSVVYTNKLRAAGFRGFGNPQVTFGTESQLDQIAEKIGMDPIEFRLKNAVQTGDTWIGGQRIPSCGFRECLERARDASTWTERRAAKSTSGKRRGIGVAGVSHICGLLGTSAIVRILEDGTMTLNTGAVDIGQGSDTALAQICASAFKVGTDRVNLVAPDSDASPYNWGTGGTRVTYMVGRAVAAAAEAAIEQIYHHASEIFECADEDLELREGGRVGIVGIPEKEIGFAEISGRAHYVTGGPIIGTNSLVYDGEAFDPKSALMEHFPFARIGTYVFGAQIVEIEIDDVTGQVEVMNVWSAHDVGRAINPGAVEGQIQGGVAQGLGYALCEELTWEDGQPTNPTMMDYKVPGSLDTPLGIYPIIVESNEPTGPFGAKGVGEPGLVGVAPAVANAIADAVGVRLTKLPMTAEAVLRALSD